MKALLLLSALISGSAYASCRDTRVIFPTNGATNVPTNVILRGVFFRGESDPVALRKGNEEVALETQPQVGHMASWKPTAPLEPRTTYTVLFRGSEQRFATGDGEDTEAPSAVEFKSITFDAPDQQTRRWSLEVEGGVDATTPRDQLLLLARHEGKIVGATPLTDPTLSTSACSDRIEPPAGSFELSLQVVDLAGNASASSEAQSTSGGCVAAPASAVLWLAVALLSRRRRARC